MGKRTFTISIVLALLPAILIAGGVDKKQLVKAPAIPLNADQFNYNKLAGGIPYSGSGQSDDPQQVGTTWYDFANYGSLTKTIVRDNAGNIHFVWTNGLDFNSAHRHVYYNYYNTTTQTLAYDEGVNVFASNRSGFTCLDVMSDNRAVVAAHANVPGMVEYPVIVGLDFAVGIGAFYPTTPIPTPAICDTVIWPHMAVDIDDRIYVFARKYPYDSDPDYTLCYYSYSDDYCQSFSQFSFADTINVPSFTVATSRISGRHAFGYHQFLEDYNNHPQWEGFLAMQINNDAYVILGESGVWDWDNPINITNIRRANINLLPDTIAAQGDTLRAYLDIDLMFDNEDVLHAMFTTRGLWEAPWDSTAPPISGLTEASFIWHWREDTEELSVVANGWWNCASNISTGGAGAWKSTICRPSMGIDDRGYIYCAYELYHDFETNPDTSASAFANGDIYVTVSTDGGYNWAEPTNITNTNSNGAAAGDCFSECFPSLAETVDDYLHIFYMEDKDAGSYVFSEGVSTENPIWYQMIPKEDIPTTPLIEQFNFHVGVENRFKVQPTDFNLMGNYPNPFNSSTNIEFSLKKAMKASLEIFDIQGRRVSVLVSGNISEGKHTVNWEAEQFASGIYFIKLTAGDITKTSKMVLLK